MQEKKTTAYDNSCCAFAGYSVVYDEQAALDSIFLKLKVLQEHITYDRLQYLDDTLTYLEMELTAFLDTAVVDNK